MMRLSPPADLLTFYHFLCDSAQDYLLQGLANAVFLFGTEIAVDFEVFDAPV